jgi:hypothetical protein
VTFARTNVSEERIASIIKVESVSKIGTMLAVTSIVTSQKATFFRNGNVKYKCKGDFTIGSRQQDTS